jgi:hypothetical protein
LRRINSSFERKPARDLDNDLDNGLAAGSSKTRLGQSRGVAQSKAGGSAPLRKMTIGSSS